MCQPPARKLHLRASYQSNQTCAVLKSLTRASKVGTGRARAAQRATTCCSFANFLLTLITLDNVKCDDLMLLAFDGSKTRGIIVSCSKAAHRLIFEFPVSLSLFLTTPTFLVEILIAGSISLLAQAPHCPPSYKARGSSVFFALISTTT